MVWSTVMPRRSKRLVSQFPYDLRWVGSTAHGDTLMLIGYSVARLSTPILPGELTGAVPSGGASTQNFQLRTYDWDKPPRKVRLSKLATDVSKIVQRLIEVRFHALLAPISC